MARVVKVNCASVAIFAILLLTQNLGCSEAKRVPSNNRKFNSGHVTKPRYPTQSSAGNSHADPTKLIYSGYNSAPNRPASVAGAGATNTQPIGWNVPKSQRPPAPGNNVHTPITATNTQGVQSSYPGANYNSYVAPGAALPPGAVIYSSPPQQTSSGLGLGSGLAAAAIGGVILDHKLTPTHTRVESAPAEKPSSADSKIIIFNNGPPGSVTTTNAAGATVITTGVAGENGTQPMPAPAPAAAPADPAIPNVPLAPIGDNNAGQPTTAPGAAPAEAAAAAAPQPAPGEPPLGGIICVPVRVNDTDPADNSKMIEVEKIACYHAPPPPPPASVAGAEMNATAPIMPSAGEGSAPLAPMSPVTAASQQLQANPTQSPLLPHNGSVKTSGAVTWLNYAACNSMTTILLPLVVAFFGLH